MKMDEETTIEELMNDVYEAIEEERLKGSTYCYFNNLPDEVIYALKNKGYSFEVYSDIDVDTLENKRITCVYLKPRRR